MAQNHPIVFEVWKGDWGLPSIDLECLKWLTYAKLAGLPMEVKQTSNPFWTPKGTLPVARKNKTVITDFKQLVQVAISKNVSPDYGLSEKEQADIFAYTQTLEEKLLPALMFVWWKDERNVNTLTRTWYARALPFPLNFYYPGKMAKDAAQSLDVHYEGVKPQELETLLYSDAEKCLTSLSIKMGDNDYMFGRPTSFDAVLFAFLAPLLKAPFPSNTLQNHLKACTNLYRFVSKMSSKYFQEDYRAFEKKKKEEAAANGGESEEYPHKRRNQIVASLFAFVAMGAYAVSTGIIQFD